MTVLALGLTPAWQQTMVFDRLQPGAVNRARQITRTAAGKVINVALAVHRLGGAARICTVLGGETGQHIARQFRSEVIAAEWQRSLVPTRVCTTLLSRETGEVTELVENAPSILPSEIEEYLVRIGRLGHRNGWTVITGSLPRNAADETVRWMLRRVGGRVLLDVRGPDLWQALPCEPDLVKPNREELEHSLGHPLETDEQLLAAMKQLIDRGAQRVLISQGPRAVWFRDRQQVLRVEPPRVHVVNPIGCGDSLAGGMAMALDAGLDWPTAIRWGVAAAALNATRLLNVDFNRDDVAAVVPEIRLQTVG